MWGNGPWWKTKWRHQMSRPGYIALTIKCGAFKLKEGTWPQYCCCYLSPCLCPGYKKFLCGIVFVFFCYFSCIIDDDYGRSHRTPCKIEFTYALPWFNKNVMPHRMLKKWYLKWTVRSKAFRSCKTCYSQKLTVCLGSLIVSTPHPPEIPKIMDNFSDIETRSYTAL